MIHNEELWYKDAILINIINQNVNNENVWWKDAILKCIFHDLYY